MHERLYSTRIILIREADEAMGINGERQAVPYTLDLEDVRGIRPFYDFGEKEQEGWTTVEFRDGEASVVTADYDALLTAWRTYRTHTDALTRIRN